MYELLTVCIVFFSIAMLAVGGLRKLQISLASAKIIVTVIMISIVVFSYCFEAKDFIRWDLLQYNDMLQAMKIRGIKYVTEDSQYAELPVVNWYMYLISQIGDYHLLTAIPMAINCTIFLYIYFDVLKRECNSKGYVIASDIAFVICVWIAVISLKMAISGIRCTWAVSLAVCGVYWEYITSQRRKLGCCLYIIAALIHEFALMVIIARLFAFVKNKKVITIAVFLFFAASDYTMEVLSKQVSNAYFVSLTAALDRYLNIHSFASVMRRISLSSKLLYMCWGAVCAYLWFVLDKVKSEVRKKNNVFSNRLMSFASAVTALAIGAVFNKLILERMMHILAYVFVMVLPYYMKVRKKYTLINMAAACVLFYMFFMCDAYGFLVNYTGVYFLAR